MSEIDIGGNLGAHIFLSHDGRDDGFDTLDIALLQRQQILQLVGVQARIGVRFVNFAQQVALLVHNRDIADRQVRDAAGNQMYDCIYLLLVERAARVKIYQDRGAWLLLFTHEHGLLADGQMNPRAIHC